MESVMGEERPASADVDRTAADLRVELGKCDLARHLALFFDSTATQLESVAAYLDYGLKNDHRCLYLTDVNTPDQLKEALRAIDVDVDGRIGAGDLVIRDASTVYLDAGFDPESMIETLSEACRDSVSDGYEGLWVAGENSWYFHTEMSFDPILDFEADFDAACPDLPVTALCQYDLAKFSEESTAKSLWTHEQFLYRYSVCENPFYVSPAEYRAVQSPSLNARLMLEQGYNLTSARREVTRRDQRLSVLSRVLRHNLRNDLNFVAGALEELGALGELNERAEDRLETVVDQLDDTIEMAEKARYVQETIESTAIERVRLGAVIERAVEEVTAEHPDAEVSVSGTRDVAVLADTNLDSAISEALRNAIVHQDAESPTIAVDVSTTSSETVSIHVRNPERFPNANAVPSNEDTRPS